MEEKILNYPWDVDEATGGKCAAVVLFGTAVAFVWVCVCVCVCEEWVVQYCAADCAALLFSTGLKMAVLDEGVSFDLPALRDGAILLFYCT